jgi:hypothetical protein
MLFFSVPVKLESLDDAERCHDFRLGSPLMISDFSWRDLRSIPLRHGDVAIPAAVQPSGTSSFPKTVWIATGLKALAMTKSCFIVKPTLCEDYEQALTLRFPLKYCCQVDDLLTFPKVKSSYKI